jgi:competence ComEA-like helix-hairpin-helix protein
MAEHAGLVAVAPAAAPKQAPAATAAPPQATAAPIEEAQAPTLDRVSLGVPPPPSTPPWSGRGSSSGGRLPDASPSLAPRGAPSITATAIATPPTFRQVRPPPGAPAAPAREPAPAAASAQGPAAAPAQPGPFTALPPEQPLWLGSTIDPLEADASATAATLRLGRPAAPAPPATPAALDRVSPAIAALLRGIAGPGEPFPDDVRAEASRRTGDPLLDLRLFRDDATRRALSALDARAFAHGGDVFIDPMFADDSTVLLHEAAHVAQQRRAGRSFIQRDVKTRKEGDWAIIEYDEGYTVRANDKEKRWEVLYKGKLWITATAPKVSPPVKIELALASSKMPEDPDDPASKMIDATDAVGVKINSEADLTITVDRTVEDSIIPTLKGKLAGIRYLFKSGGEVTFKGGPKGDSAKEVHAAPMRLDTVEDRTVEPREQNNYQTKERRDLFHIEKLPNSFPTFSTLEELRKFLEAAPKNNFLILKMPDGKYVARAVAEDDLQRLASAVRNDSPDTGMLENLARYEGKAAKGEVISTWLEGKEYPTLDSLKDRFYNSDLYAEFGAGKGGSPQPECEIFEMGSKSFGRRPLTHDQAVSLWEEFDRLPRDSILKRESEPGHKFVALIVKGATKMHRLDQLYLDGRDEIKTRLAAVESSPGGADEEARASELRASELVQNFIKIELDREKDNPEFIKLLGQTPKQGTPALGKMVWNQVAYRAQGAAVDAIENANKDLVKILDDPKQFEAVIRGLPDASEKERTEVLSFLGVDDKMIGFYERDLGNKEVMQRFLYKEEFDHTNKMHIGIAPPPSQIVSYDKLVEIGRGQVEHLKEVVEKLRTFDFFALDIEGELGEKVRSIAYADFGIKLDPKDYPHRGKTKALDLTPTPLAGDRSSFTNTFEQMFANEAKRRDTIQWAEKIGKKLAGIAAAVLVILAARQLGLGIAAYFRIAATTAEATAIVTTTTALGLTGLSALEKRLYEGKWPGAGENIQEFYKQLLMMAAFTKLGAQLEGKSFFMRMGAMAGAGIGSGVLEFIAVNKRVPSWSEFGMIVAENIVMLAVLEAGSYLARPLDKKLSIWDRGRRLQGTDVKYEDLMKRSQNLHKDIASLQAKPQQAASEADALRKRAEVLADEQARLAQEIVDKVPKNDPDAAAMQSGLAEEKAALKEVQNNFAEADLIAKLKLRAVADSPYAFEYTPDPAIDPEAELKKIYPDADIVKDADGVFRITPKGAKEPYILYPPGKAPAPVPAKGALPPKQLNLNTATPEEIAALDIKGIKDKTAEKIVKARDEKGLFSSWDDLKKIPDIGDKTIDKLKTKAVIEPPGPKLSFKERATAVKKDAQAIIDRADKVGVKHPTIEALRKMLEDGLGVTEKGIADGEAKVALARKAGVDAIDAAGTAARKRVIDRVGKKVFEEQVLTGILKDMPESAVNDALTQIPLGTQNLDVAQIRGVIHAGRLGVDLAGFWKIAKAKGVPARNFALEMFAALGDARIPGAAKVMKDMSTTGKKWDGGMFALEQVKFTWGLDQVAQFEMKVESDGVEREVDVVLKDGTRIELKNWEQAKQEWLDHFYFQFIKDVKLSGNDPKVFEKHRYIFRKPAPLALDGANGVKAQMRKALQTHLSELRSRDAISAVREREILDAFDAEAAKSLVTEVAPRTPDSVIDPKQPPAVGPPPGSKKDDDKVPNVPGNPPTTPTSTAQPGAGKE